MNLRQQLITVSDAYCQASGLSASRVSTLIFNDGKRLPAIRAGGDLATARYEHAMQWMSDRWPADAVTKWPCDIDRPAPTPAPEQQQTEAAE